jgi:tetratricopeptide (TPR) repeat protein
MKKTTFLMSSMFLALSMLSYSPTEGQVLKSPEASQEAKSYQKIGVTDLAVWYHSPQVKDREIFGALVPYDQIWRAGANENTIFYTSTDITIEGELLPAGKYGLHMIPGPEEWTVIFSSNHSSWGSYFYDDSEDVLRVKVNPSEHAHTEWLNYTYSDRSSDHAVLEMQWDKVSVPIRIEVDVVETTFHSMQKEIRGIYGFSWQGHNQIARYCLKNLAHLEEGYEHAQSSLNFGRNFNNLMTCALYEEMYGNTEKEKALIKEAMDMANEQQMNAYGYQLMGMDNLIGAQEIFEQNAKAHPDSWNCWDSLAECYLLQGDKKNALKYYKKALGIAPDNQKDRIEGIISNI